MTPNEAELPENRAEVAEHLRERATPSTRPPLQEGDTVKIVRKPRNAAEHRLHFVGWSDRLYKVDKIEADDTGMPRYRVNGDLFTRNELLKVEDAQRPVEKKRVVDEKPVFRIASSAPEEERQPLRRLRHVRFEPEDSAGDGDGGIPMPSVLHRPDPAVPAPMVYEVRAAKRPLSAEKKKFIAKYAGAIKKYLDTQPLKKAPLWKIAQILDRDEPLWRNATKLAGLNQKRQMAGVLQAFPDEFQIVGLDARLIP